MAHGKWEGGTTPKLSAQPTATDETEKELQQAKEGGLVAALEAARKAGTNAESSDKEEQPKKKKKKKSDKKEARKRRKASGTTDTDGTTGKEDSGKSAGMKSNLKTGRFSGLGTTSTAKPTRQLFKDHNHVYKKEYINASMKLKEEDKHAEWMLSLKMIFGEMKKVDSNLVFESVAPGSKQGRVEDHTFCQITLQSSRPLSSWLPTPNLKR